MGRDIPPVRDKDTDQVERARCAFEGEELPPWPQINKYKEKGVVVRVFKAAWAEGSEVDHIVKPPRKGKN